MQDAYRKLLDVLESRGFTIEAYPDLQGKGQNRGMAAAKAYPIQGILKYHGMADWDLRTAYLPSISVNNDAAYSLTLVEFDPALTEDQVFINGEVADGRALLRVQQCLNGVRQIGGVESYAKVWSKNVVRASLTGKGLGTSASASAAVATAAIAAIFGDEAVHNTRFLSCMARLLAGSGCRSAVGGISLWLSYADSTHEESFAIRLDQEQQLAQLRLITVPIDSRIGLSTESAHRDAPNSSFFNAWIESRLDETVECIDAVQAGDWRTIGQLAELDSVRLHGVTMSGSRENKLFAWESENIPLFRMCNELRSQDIPVYFSTDTGPTVVFLTHQDYEQRVVDAIHKLNLGFEVIRGGLGGPAQLLDVEQAKDELKP